MPASPNTPGILDLPHELIFMVLGFTNSIPDLAALIRTAPVFNNVWKLRTASISEAVLSKDIESFPQTLLLEETLHPEPPIGFDMKVQRHNRIVKAALCANEAWNLFLRDWKAKTPYRGHYPIHDSDRPMFKETLYWMWRVVATATYKPFLSLPQGLNENLDQLSRWHILPLCELTVWLAGRSNARLKRMTAKMRKTYLPRDRTRYAYHHRWVDCCQQLWHSSYFTKCHNDHFLHDLRAAPIIGPPYGRLYYGPNYWELYHRLSAARQSYQQVSPFIEDHAVKN